MSLESLYAGTGIGISITANKKLREFVQQYVYRLLLLLKQPDFTMTQTSLRFGGRVVGPGLAVKIVDTFQYTIFRR